MADFCQECSIHIFGDDFRELAGITTAEAQAQDLYACVLCECCGPIQVDTAGRCINDDAPCPCKEKHPMGNTDADEIARGTSEPANSGMTSGVRDGNTQGVDGRFQNDGADDIKPEVDPVEEEPQGDELGSIDEAADGVEDDDGL